MSILAEGNHGVIFIAGTFQFSNTYTIQIQILVRVQEPSEMNLFSNHVNVRLTVPMKFTKLASGIYFTNII